MHYLSLLVEPLFLSWIDIKIATSMTSELATCISKKILSNKTVDEIKSGPSLIVHGDSNCYSIV